MKTVSDFKEYIDDIVVIAEHLQDVPYDEGTENMLINTKVTHEIAKQLKHGDFLRATYRGRR